MLHLTLITHDKNSRQVACFFVSLAQNMNDKRLGCLKIVHAHTGLQVNAGVYHKTSPFRKCWVVVTQNMQ